MLAQKYTEHYTVEDYQYWEGDWELVDGVAYAMSPSPSFTHQSINIKIARLLDEALDNCPKCQAIFEIDWEVSSDTVVKPDMLVICYEVDEKITKKPELIFEIASRSTVKRDEILKFELYQREGVEYFVLVYPDKKVAKVYRLNDGVYRKVGDFSDELYKFELKECEIDFNFSKIWRVK
ncbi:MAG: Uma2 family endonuclease [Sulfurovum sp.]|nr:MAG: Uma2 family endonuclease [Sulfurovum sp.]